MVWSTETNDRNVKHYDKAGFVKIWGIGIYEKRNESIWNKTNIRGKIESEPDLKYYLDNEYTIKIIDLLVEGISEAFEKIMRS